MAKTKKPRASKTPAAPTANPVADFFRLPEPEPPPTLAHEAEVDKPDPTQELLRRFDALNDELKARDRQIEDLRRNQLQLMQAPAYTPPAPAPAPQRMELPDPLKDPEAHARALASQVQAQIDQRLQADKAAAERERQNSQRLSALWDDFSSKYGDLAEHTDMVEFATDKVLKAAMARGIDAQKYMLSPDGIFLDDVAKEVRKLLPEEDEEEDDEPAPGRTAGLHGGQEGGYKPTAPPKGKEQPNFETQLANIQRTSGFF